MQEKIRKVAKIKLENCKNSFEKEKYEIIYKILQDDNCFKMMKTETAYKLLSDLDFNAEEIKKMYNEIIFNH